MKSDTSLKEIQTTQIQSLISLGKEIHGCDFKNFLDNFPKFSWSNFDIDLSINMKDFEYYSDATGNQELRKRIARVENLKYPFQLQKENIGLTNGSTHSIFVVLFYLKTLGYKKVYLPYPSFSGYKHACEIVGLEYAPYDLPNGYDNPFENLSIEEEKFVFIINTPHNPTGTYLKEEGMAKLMTELGNKDYRLLFDVVYDQLVYKEYQLNWGKFISPVHFSRCFWVSSLSKNYGLPGIRIGWVMSDTENIERIEPFIETSLMGVNNVAQNLALKILQLDTNVFKDELKERRDYLCKSLMDIDELAYRPPNSGTTIMVKALGFKVEPFLSELLIKHGIGLLPGSAYYGDLSHSFRLSFGYHYSEMDCLVETMKRMFVKGVKGKRTLKKTQP